jgi:hypothetical protein
MFLLAIVSVVLYLALKGGGVLHWWPKSAAEASGYVFTFLGVLLPTFGGAIAGIRYFGDFERFSAISTVTAERLTAIDLRAQLLLAAPDGEMDYGRVADRELAGRVRRQERDGAGLAPSCLQTGISRAGRSRAVPASGRVRWSPAVR